MTSIPTGVYTLRNNGLRCFVSPCFSWDVLDTNGRIVATVSDVGSAPLLDMSDTEILHAALLNNGVRVRGYAIELPENDGVRNGVRFIIEDIEDY